MALEGRIQRRAGGMGQDPDPEAGQGLVVEAVVPVRRREATDAGRNGGPRRLGTQEADLEPGEPQMIAVMELGRCPTTRSRRREGTPGRS